MSDTPPHILMLLTNPFVADPRVYKEARTLVQAGYRVTVLAWDRQKQYPATQIIDGIDVKRIQIGATYGRRWRQLGGFLRFYGALCFHLMTTAYDAVHCHDLDTWLPGVFCGRLRGKKVILDAHEPEYYPYLSSGLKAGVNWLEGFLARRSHTLVVTSDFQAGKYQRLRVTATVKVANYPALDFSGKQAADFRQKPLVIGWIGHLRVDDGTEDLIAAFQSLQPCYPTLELLIVGPGPHDYRQKLAALIARQPAGIRFQEGVAYGDVPGLYRQLHIAAMLYRPAPEFQKINVTKLYEAMANGIPIVATAISELPEIIAREQSGLIVTQDGIATAIEYLLNHPEEAEAMGRRGRTAFEQRYNWELMEENLRRVYQASLGDSTES